MERLVEIFGWTYRKSIDTIHLPKFALSMTTNPDRLNSSTILYEISTRTTFNTNYHDIGVIEHNGRLIGIRIDVCKSCQSVTMIDPRIFWICALCKSRCGPTPDSFEAITEIISTASIPSEDDTSFVEEDDNEVPEIMAELGNAYRVGTPTASPTSKSKPVEVIDLTKPQRNADGYVYIFQTPPCKEIGVYKVGMTTRSITERLREYERGTEMMLCIRTSDARAKEKQIIKKLRAIKDPDEGREWFAIDLDIIRKIVVDECNIF